MMPNFVTMSQATPALNSDYVIKGILLRKAICGLLAQSGEGKSFVNTYLAAHCSLGLDCFGHRSNATPWLIVQLEGFKIQPNRMSALKKEFPSLENADVEVTDYPINLLQRSSCKAFVEAVREHESMRGKCFGVVAIDTVNAATPGMNENDSAPMSSMLANVRFIRDELNVAMILVHHLGKDTTRGARGHSSFHAALDAELTIERNGDVRTLKSTKQRDFETGTAIATFKLRSVTLGKDEDGDMVTSCVVEQVDAAVFNKPKTRGPNQESAMVALREWSRANPDAKHIASPELADLLKRQGIGAKRKPEVITWLCSAGILTNSVGGFTICKELL